MSKRRDPQLAKTDPRCPVCLRPTGAADGSCAGTGSLICYQLAYTRVSQELALCKAQLRGVVSRVDEVVEQLDEESSRG